MGGRGSSIKERVQGHRQDSLDVELQVTREHIFHCKQFITKGPQRRSVRQQEKGTIEEYKEESWDGELPGEGKPKRSWGGSLQSDSVGNLFLRTQSFTLLQAAMFYSNYSAIFSRDDSAEPRVFVKG